MMPGVDEWVEAAPAAQFLNRDDYFHCFLADQPSHLVPARLVEERLAGGTSENLVVNPDAWFSWRDGKPGVEVDPESLPAKFLGDSELLWVTDAATGMQTPFWAGPWFQGRLADLWPGQAAPLGMSRDLCKLLKSAGVLVKPDAASVRRQEWARFSSKAGRDFAENGHAAIGQWTHPYLLGALRRYYRRLLRTGGMTLGDAGSAGRYVVHNDSVARFFHQQLGIIVSAISGVPVKPSYVYVAAYQSGADLASHTDREQCEYSITTLIDHSPEPVYQSPWPLYLETKAGTIPVWQGLGEGLLYRGRELPHYRKRLPDGMSSTSIFFHYVDEDYAGPLD